MRFGAPTSGGRSNTRSNTGRPTSGGRFGSKTAADGPSRFAKKRTRRFGNQVIRNIDYKNIDVLKNFLSEKGKILPRRIVGLSSKEQRLLARAVKRSRHSGLLAFQQM